MATTKISALTAAIAGNVTDATVLPLVDATTTTVKVSLAQVRTQLFAASGTSDVLSLPATVIHKIGGVSFARYSGTTVQVFGGTGGFNVVNSTDSGFLMTLSASGALALGSGLTIGATTFMTSTVALTNGAAAQAGTLLNAPVAGNPTKWLLISDNGTNRYIPAW